MTFLLVIFGKLLTFINDFKYFTKILIFTQKIKIQTILQLHSPLNIKIMSQQPPLNIEISPEISFGVYSNLALIAHSSAEFVFDFIQIMPGNPKAQVRSRIITAPEHAKRLLLALQDNVQKYEKAFGTIDLPEINQNYPPFVGGGPAGVV